MTPTLPSNPKEGVNPSLNTQEIDVGAQLPYTMHLIPTDSDDQSPGHRGQLHDYTTNRIVTICENEQEFCFGKSHFIALNNLKVILHGDLYLDRKNYFDSFCQEGRVSVKESMEHPGTIEIITNTGNATNEMYIVDTNKIYLRTYKHMNGATKTEHVYVTDKTNIYNEHYLWPMPDVNTLPLAAPAATASEPNEIPFFSTTEPFCKGIILDYTSDKIASVFKNNAPPYPDNCYFLALKGVKVLTYGTPEADAMGQFCIIDPNDQIIVRESSEPGKIEIAHYEAFFKEERKIYTVDMTKVYLRRKGLLALDPFPKELVYVTDQTDMTVPGYLTLQS